MPYALIRKNPKTAREWACQYVFPSKNISIDPQSETQRQHHIHESVLLRTVKQAVRLSAISKHVGYHTFRHCFATHLLESGTNIRTFQELFSQKDLKTTMIYTHVMKKPGIDICSPLDTVTKGNRGSDSFHENQFLEHHILPNNSPTDFLYL